MPLPTQQQKHIEAWQLSSLSQVAYCRQYQLNSNTKLVKSFQFDRSDIANTAGYIFFNEINKLEKCISLQEIIERHSQSESLLKRQRFIKLTKVGNGEYEDHFSQCKKWIL